MRKKKNNNLDWGEITKRVVEFIESLGLSQRKAGEIIGVEQSNLSKVLRGERNVTEAFIDKLVASPLKADKNYLLYGVKSDNSDYYESNDNPYKIKYYNKIEEINNLKDEKIVLLNEKAELKEVITNLKVQIEQLKGISRKQSGGSASGQIANAG